MTTIFMRIRAFIEKQSDLNLLLFVTILTFFCYLNIFFGHEFLTYDDNWYIYENKNVINLSWESIVESFTSTKGGQYSPIAETYHAILYHFFGKNATAFKFFALLTHLLNVVLVFKLFKYLSSNRWLVIFVSLVFAIHPLQVETIGWISVIYKIAALFMLLGYFFYCRYLQNQYNWKYLTLVIVFFILALFTKEQAILFPIGLFLINLNKGFNLFRKRIIVENILFGMIAVIFALITVEITKKGGPSIVGRETSFFGNIALLSETITVYLYNFILPINLSFSYPYPLKFVATPKTYFFIFMALGILITATIASLKNKQFLFGVLWVFGFLSIAFSFSFFHLRDAFMADRYIYFAIIGLAYILFFLLKNLHEGAFKNTLIPQFLGGFFILMLITMTVNRVPIFKNSYTLWTDAVAKNSENPLAYNSLGYYHRNINDLNSALSNYKKALTLNPQYYLAHSNIGKVYFEQKKYDLALLHINKALLLSPNYETGHRNRAAVNKILNNHLQVIEDLNFLLNKTPSDLSLKLERAKTYFKLKKYTECIADCNAIITSNRATNYTYYLKGHSLFLQNKNTEAIVNLTKAINLKTNIKTCYYIRSLSYFKIKNYKLAYKDALLAKKQGYKVPEKYLNVLSKIGNK